MDLLVDFPEEPGVNNENIVLNYTTSDSLNPGEWTHTINPNLNLTPNARDINPSCCGKHDPMDDDDEKQIIVFASNRDTNDGNHEIYSISVYGGNETRLTNNLTNDQFPSWSPDGTKIVFGSNRDGNYEIYTMNADCTTQTRLTNHINTDYYPTWSHDGAKIAFTSWRDGNGEIYTMDADGTHDPKYIKKMLVLSSNYDLVITNRFLSKNSLRDWTLFRKFLTKLRYHMINLTLGISYDTSGAFRCYNLNQIKKKHILLAKDNGYSFFWESTFLLENKLYKIFEIPIKLPFRIIGSSKMRYRDMFFALIYLALYFLKKNLGNIK